MSTHWRETPSGLIVPERPAETIEGGETKGPRSDELARIMGGCTAPSPMPTMKARPFGNLDPDWLVMRCYCDDEVPREVKC